MLGIAGEPLPPPHPHLRAAAASCELHPEETVTGFCASCLRERLAGLDAAAASASAAAAAPGRKSTSALKSLFSKVSGGGGGGGGAQAPSSSSCSSAAFLRPELRRCKSFSCGRGGGGAPATSFEPRAAPATSAAQHALDPLPQDDRDRSGRRRP
ncbi:UPF0503 protein, chloroplastic [Ananas comosus]|uniref:UPF0503 protein, chloroplastic n=1 Tax=Ananas comosus TaxID=4615 RepID=A0A199UXV4_ANACO|nr:UPF0503 protein, chloroplastic [Ananas comosus]